jgi:hypothetical protein
MAIKFAAGDLLLATTYKEISAESNLPMLHRLGAKYLVTTENLAEAYVHAD